MKKNLKLTILMVIGKTDYVKIIIYQVKKLLITQQGNSQTFLNN